MPRKGQSRADQKNKGRGSSSLGFDKVTVSEEVPVVPEVKKVVVDTPVVTEEKPKTKKKKSIFKKG